jgi:hypothetical protein
MSDNLAWLQNWISSMPTPELSWTRPCESYSCIEYAEAQGYIYIRVSDEPDTVVRATQAEWNEFVAAIREDH